MRTKSFRIASAVSCSTIRVPVSPPASPVATTGTSSRLSARATLIPFPPARVRPPLARCRWPRWKLGTVSVRSRAALRVTVTIIRLRDPSPHVVRGAPEIPARAADRARLVDRTGGDERRACDEASPLVDPHLAQLLTLPDRQLDASRRHDALHERTAGDDGPPDRPRRHEVDRFLPVRRSRSRVDVPRVDRLDDAEAGKPPGHQLRQVVVAPPPRRAPEDRRVNGDARAADGAHFGPAGLRRVAGLHADHPRVGPEQVVPRMQAAA